MKPEQKEEKEAEQPAQLEAEVKEDKINAQEEVLEEPTATKL